MELRQHAELGPLSQCCSLLTAQVPELAPMDKGKGRPTPLELWRAPSLCPLSRVLTLVRRGASSKKSPSHLQLAPSPTAKRSDARTLPCLILES